MPSEWDLAFRLLVAVGLGALVGLERELYDQPAGLRTHMTVALGAALFGVVGAYAFDEFTGDQSFRVDPTRVAAGVAQGVGFLGGGAILKSGNDVRGLTTAASLWVVAAIGLGVGLGSVLVAAVATLVLLVALFGVRFPRRVVSRRWARTRPTVVLRLKADRPAGPVIDLLHSLDKVDVRSIRVSLEGPAAAVEAELTVAPGVRASDRLRPLHEHADVAEVAIAAIT